MTMHLQVPGIEEVSSRQHWTQHLTDQLTVVATMQVEQLNTDHQVRTTVAVEVQQVTWQWT
jgi:hypothetical protein